MLFVKLKEFRHYYGLGPDGGYKRQLMVRIATIWIRPGKVGTPGQKQNRSNMELERNTIPIAKIINEQHSSIQDK